MVEENQSNSSANEENIYLEVIHIPSRPPSRRSCQIDKDPDQKQQATMEKILKKSLKETQKTGKLTHWILIATIMLLTAVCCALGALYVIERRNNSMMGFDNRKNEVTSTPSTNCATGDSSGKEAINNVNQIFTPIFTATPPIVYINFLSSSIFLFSLTI